MTMFDYAVLVILGLSVLLSVIRGGVSEMISLGAWLLAFVLAQHFAAPLSAHLPQEIPTEPLRIVAAFVGIFLGVWFFSAIVRITLAQFIKASGLAPLDRLIGALFGLARGCLLCVVLVIVAGMTSLPRQPVWRNAMFSPPLEAMATVIKPVLPEALSRQVRYE
ncbi:CvpA family protein [Burkholderiaceae bacterium DAT-1]|nr:CvpA family protein [Burkholderiaceae bacterium DAT-1]